MRKQIPDTPAPAPAKPRRLEGHPSHEIRIIGGLWKRTRLKVADRPGLRPTPDRVRETLFNWLGQDLSGWRCLDAFAGTGVLGFEAASRGAAQVLMLEQDAALVTQLMALKTRLGATAVHVERGDGVMALKKATPGTLELIFLDPPFDSALFEKALAAAAHAASLDGFIYLEAPKAWNDEALLPFALGLRRHLKAGAVHAHLLVRLG
jgi:16S rRNA (guanine(966)-N(2))-methyltransferase RsmD